MDCFITRRGYIDGGGSATKVTPEKLGYVTGAKVFFDGRYNTPYKHVSDGSVWTDLVQEKDAHRVSLDTTTAKDLIAPDYYIKTNSKDAGIVIPEDMSDYTNFSVEALVKIISLDSYQSDIIDTYASDNYGGFGVTAENSTKLTLQAYSSGWKNMTTFYTIGNIIHVALTYDGTTLKSYFNGTYISEMDCSYGINNNIFPCLGVKAGGRNEHAGGKSNYYRVAIYNKVLSQEEILQNYNRDVYRYVNGNPDDISGDVPTTKSNILCGGNVYTGTEYEELTKPITELKNELINYFGFSGDGDFVPCNADGTIGFTISSTNIQQNYGADKIRVDESMLRSTYSVILKNEKILAFKNGEQEIHVAVKDKSGNVVLIWCYNSMFSITNASGTTGIAIPHTAYASTSFVHYAVPMCDFMTGNEIDGLHLVIASKSNEYTNYFVDFGGDIYRLFGQGATSQGKHQFAVKVSN